MEKRQLSFLPPELSPIVDFEGGHNWVSVMVAIAREEGYNFNGGAIGRHCKMWHEQFGSDSLYAAWRTWLQNGPILGEQAGYMNPKSFADKFGYWLKMSEPAR